MLEDDCRAPSDGSTGGIGGGNCGRIDARREHRRAARSRGPEGRDSCRARPRGKGGAVSRSSTGPAARRHRSGAPDAGTNSARRHPLRPGTGRSRGCPGPWIRGRAGQREAGRLRAPGRRRAATRAALRRARSWPEDNGGSRSVPSVADQMVPAVNGSACRRRSEPCPRKRKNPGDDLFSRKAALSVSSALESLTSVFGMGTGMASPLESPGFVASGRSAAGRAALDWCRGAGRQGLIFDLVKVSQEMILISQPLTPGQLLKRSSPRPLVPLSFIRHRTSTCGLYNRWSPCGLTRLTRWGTSSRGELRT